MKKAATKLLSLCFLLPFLSFDSETLVNHPMPLLANKTLDGKVIDENYYKGHVTVVSFMFIGCMPCMMEITSLNKIASNYRGNQQLQVLCVARQMGQQMIDFNGDTSTLFGKVRHAIGADAIGYAILPACENAKSKMTDTGTAVRNVYLKSECSTIEEKYGFTAFPTIFFVDKKGMVRKIHTGGPGTKDDPAFYNDLKQEVDRLLAE